MLSLGSKFGWMHWHYVASVLVFVLFFVRIGFSSSSASSELVMCILLLIVIAIELIGWVTNYFLKCRVSLLPEEIVLNRISDCREQLKRKVENRLLETVKLTKSNALADYYIEHLAEYFAQSRHLLTHLKGDIHPYLKINHHLQQYASHFNQLELAFVKELEEYIKQKDSLDEYLAVKGFVKSWDWLHAPLALFLFALVAVNMILLVT